MVPQKPLQLHVLSCHLDLALDLLPNGKKVSSASLHYETEQDEYI